MSPTDPNQIVFSIGRLISWLSYNNRGEFTGKDVCFIAASALDEMGVIYNACPLRELVDPNRRVMLKDIAHHDEVLRFLFPLGRLVAHRRPDANWDITFDEALHSLKFIYLG